MHQRPYERLVAWQEAHKLCVRIHALVVKFPGYERQALADQMRRSSYSVPLNIAEGNSKKTPNSKKQFFGFALASLEELHSQTQIARDLGYITSNEYNQTDDHINRTSYLLTRLNNAF